MRDMMPNHLFQLVLLTTTEPPVSIEANAVRDEQAKVLRAFRPLSPEEVLSCAVRGQYGKGNIQSSPRGTNIPLQDKPKEKHAKTHINQMNKD